MSELTDVVKTQLVSGGRAGTPSLLVSYDGANEPVSLWAELSSLGWTIPARPPTPAQAIDWTPNPTTGEDFTIRSWPVSEFRITSENAAAGATPGFARLTLHRLRQLGVEVQITDTYEEKLLSVADDQIDPSPRTATSVEFDWPTLIAIDDPSASQAATSAGFRTVSAALLARPDGLLWAESTIADDIRLGFARSAEMSWSVEFHDTPPRIPGDKSPLGIIVPDSRDDAGLVQRLQGVSADALEVALLHPSESNTTSKIGLLIMTSVAPESHAKLSSVLMSNYPQIIVRGISD